MSESVARKQPVLADKPRGSNTLVYLFVIAPFVALIAAPVLVWGWGVSWLDIGLSIAFYMFSVLGVTVGYHRYFTHGAFKAKRGLRIGLAIAGMFGFQGTLFSWIPDHRRHHAFSDREGDPHSPWLHGTSAWGLAKGFWHAHLGWLFDKKEANLDAYAPDLRDDPDMRRANGWFGWISLINLTLPGIIGGVVTWSWWGAVTAFFWAGLVRVAIVHHVTWSTNSICHMIGDRPYKSRDKAANFWPLAILSMGESWHNTHHADPTCARHGVDRGQIDISARVIWLFEKFGWVHDVRWPRKERFDKLRATTR